MRFTGFLPGDLDNFRPERQSSNSWNRQRLEVKERALALGAVLQARLAEEGLSLSLEASDANPSVWNRRKVDALWVFLWRSPQEREALQAVVDHEKKLADSILDPTPFKKHVFLCVRLFELGVEIGMRLHRDAWVDHKNLRSRCASEEGTAQVVALLNALPERFFVAAPDVVEAPARDVDSAGLDGILGAFGETSEWLAVGERLDLPEVVALEERLVDRATDSLRALVPLYGHVAWSRDNDWTRLDEALEAQAAARQEARLALETERQEREAARREQAREAAARTKEKERDAALARAHAAFGAKPRRAERASSTTSPKPAVRAAPQAKPPPKAAKRTVSRQVPAKLVERSAPTEIAKGVRVRITAGPFAGKVGTVAELDARGQVKVLLGLLVARVEKSQVTVVGRG